MKALIGLILLVGAVEAGAVTVGEVSCYEDGCLVRGWMARDYRSGGVGYVDCLDRDCANRGWYESYSFDNRIYEAICDRDGCFKDGWTVYDRFTRQAVADTRCMIGQARTPDCMNGGWVAREFYYGRQMMSYCINNDCAHEGWFAYLPNGGYQRSYCKEGACFERGWIVDQR